MNCEICKEFIFIEEVAFINKEAYCLECSLEVDRQFFVKK